MTTRVLVVEDSLTVRAWLVAALTADPEFDVVGEAEDGAAAIELCRRSKPDVVTMDMMLRGLSGLAATEAIMESCPTPILIVSASTNRGELFRTYDALAAGAVDVLEKPTGREPDGEWAASFRAQVRLVSRIRVITHHHPARAARKSAVSLPRGPGAGTSCRAIAIGASTGGPAAIVSVLGGLPADFPLPILLVIHIGQAFARSLAEWLDGLSPIRVSTAADGDPLPPPGCGCVLMPPADRHLEVRDGRIRVGAGPERHSCRPSVDVLFESAAADLGPAVAGCLLTGMGRDGADGLLAIRRAGGQTIAQDEESCVVFGMPREAITLGAAGRVLPLPQISAALLQLAGSAPAKERR